MKRNKRYGDSLSRDARDYYQWSKTRWAIEKGQEKHDVDMEVMRATKSERIQFAKDKYELRRSRGEVQLEMQRKQLEDMRGSSRHNMRKELCEYRDAYINAGHPFPDGQDEAVVKDWWIDCLIYAGFTSPEIIEQFPQFI